MGWQIDAIYNDVVIPKALREDFEHIADENYHCISFSDNGYINFDPDAQEHADFLKEDLALNLMNDAEANGHIIWASLEGDRTNPDIWGYEFKNGKLVDLSKKEIFLFLAGKTE